MAHMLFHVIIHNDILTNLWQPPQVDRVMHALNEKGFHSAVDGSNSYTISNPVVHYRATADL